jgi:4-diphosphocytidyl-2-C-methyl-D-erythritol kinase
MAGRDTGRRARRVLRGGDAAVSSAPAHAKINLALVVGPLRADGKHELLTVFQRLTLADDLRVEPAAELRVDGFAGDTLVRAGLEALAAAAGANSRWHARIWKRIPVAGGLGGGSSDAATALRLANATLQHPLSHPELERLAAGLGSDVPFFLRPGPQLGAGDGTQLSPLDLPHDYAVVLALDSETTKTSTAEVYRAFDERNGPAGWEERRQALLAALARTRDAADLAALPPNDLASSPLADELRTLGAFRADVTGAGPTVYGLFVDAAAADVAAKRLERPGLQVWAAAPAWYG